VLRVQARTPTLGRTLTRIAQLIPNNQHINVEVISAVAWYARAMVLWRL